MSSWPFSNAGNPDCQRATNSSTGLELVLPDRDLVVKGLDKAVPHGIGDAPDVRRSLDQAVEDDEVAVGHLSIRAEPTDRPAGLSTAQPLTLSRCGSRLWAASSTSL